MGDRAVVLFVDDKDSTDYMGGVYLHWHGARVPSYIEDLRNHMGHRKGDASYAAARFTGICHNEIEGNLSLGLIPAPDEHALVDWAGYSHGDNGVFIVECTTFTAQHKRYDNYNDTTWYVTEELEAHGG